MVKIIGDDITNGNENDDIDTNNHNINNNTNHKFSLFSSESQELGVPAPPACRRTNESIANQVGKRGSSDLPPGQAQRHSEHLGIANTGRPAVEL